VPRDLAREIEDALQNGNLQQALAGFTGAVGFLRAQAIADLPDYEGLRGRARRIKAEAIENLDALLEQLKESVEARGGRVVFARDGEEALRYVRDLIRAHGVRRIVKSKSMTAEEIGLAERLEALGVSVLETDLGERIVQLARERPSHLIGPALHKTLDEVRGVFREWLGLEDPPREPAELARLARQALRDAFFEAEMGITGANFAVAETGHLMLVENEGNIRLTARLPKVHVALMGVEKVLPALEDLTVFLKLLPRSGTGQKLTSYVSLFAPRPGLHLIVLDNGRSRLRADPELREALYCIRCGACLDSCPSYQAVGGHVFGGRVYMGGIGTAWTAGVDGLEEAAEFHGLCTSCGRCTEVCPVKIDIPWLNTAIRSRARQLESPRHRRAARVLGEIDRWARWGSLLAPLGNRALHSGPGRRLVARALGLDPERTLPKFARPTFRAQARTRPRSQRQRLGAVDGVKLFVDCFTNHFEPGVGLAALRVLERLGVRVELARNVCCGRAALSQGLLERARALANENARRLLPELREGETIVGIEPSCVAALRSEYRHLLPPKEAEGLRERVRDVMEFLAEPEISRRLSELLPSEEPKKVVYHGHCQQKALGSHGAIVALLRDLPGLEVQTVEVACCGMAGSFGYKREFAALSRHLGRRLVGLVEAQGQGGEPVACGFSCRSQLRDLGGLRARHPVQILDELLAQSQEGSL